MAIDVTPVHIAKNAARFVTQERTVIIEPEVSIFWSNVNACDVISVRVQQPDSSWISYEVQMLSGTEHLSWAIAATMAEFAVNKTLAVYHNGGWK